ncbi:LamG domain-containing protein [uncultured Jatrophihabitans sp.]|uniref:LamG domain-containing protein n=1 Tax=uncultured Jatrophihabitans sp. TaxID=1610747 RepID=UPI0035C994AD
MSANVSPFATRSARRWIALVAVLAAIAAFVSALAQPARAAAATGPGPIQQPSASNVTADALPTVQMDGVAWTQVIVGNTVYVGGKFANARPYGSAAGTNQTPRTDMLAYDLTTGNLITAFNPLLNGQVTAVAASADGKTIYIGGDFTTVNGKTHSHIAALDATTGAPISTFTANASTTVKSLIATPTALYAGGAFTTANGVARSRLAAYTPAGGLTAWAPSADYTVNAMTLTPDKSKVVVGGAFDDLNGVESFGIGAVDAASGASVPWAVNQTLRDYGSNSAIESLSADANAVYGSGYNYGGKDTRAYEGAWSANPADGSLNWLEDCHGDTYGVFGVNNIVYTVSHAHFCANDGGWPVYDPWQYRHSVAFTANATGTLLPNSMAGNYNDFAGQPAPSIINWFPDFTNGTVTGQSQAAWTITGNSNYIVEGGEFPTVNNSPQAGLVRFAVRGAAGNPGKQGPMLTGTSFQPNLNPVSGSVVGVTFGANWDRDDKTLTYTLTRNGQQIWTSAQDSEWWSLPTLSYTDSGLTAGNSYTYQLTATDPNGNSVTGAAATVTTPGGTAASGTAYDQKVLADGASSYWTLGEASGSTAASSVGTNPLTLGSGVTRGVAGPVSGETASAFNGTSTGFGATKTAVAAPNTFTISAWVKTTSTSGGKLFSFGDAATGSSSKADRQLYLDNAGHAYFGVYSGGKAVTVNSSAAVNDGTWHLLTGSLGSGGLTLYVDGVKAGSSTGATSGQTNTGYWRVGGDSISSSWPGSPTSKYLNAAIGDVAVFPTVLGASTVSAEYAAASSTTPPGGGGGTPPANNGTGYDQKVLADGASSYWTLGEASGTTSASSVGTNPLVVGAGVTRGVAGPVSGETASGFNGTSTGSGSTQTAIAGPNTFTYSAWVNTTSTTGGKILGFGSATTGSSAQNDRSLYLDNAGHVYFGVYSGGKAVTVSSTSTVNNGAWHLVAASLGTGGLVLYVDGAQVASSTAATKGQAYDGYWRVGGDNISASWAGAPTSKYLKGSIGDVAIFPVVLSASTVAAEYAAA